MLRIRDIMTRAVVTVHVDDTLERIRAIFEESRFHHLVVLDEAGRLAGVVSDRDLLKNLSPFIDNKWMERLQDRNTLSRKAHQIMRRRPVAVDEDMPLTEAAERLLAEGVSCLPVVTRDRRIVGIVSWRDLLPHCFTCEPEEPPADAEAA